MFLWEFFIFLFSSIPAVLITYYKIPTNISQLIIVVLLIVLVIFSGKFLFSGSIVAQNKHARLILLFFSSLFIQLFINTTGGLLSPFLILLHIFTLGISFLLSLRSAIIFLFFSISVLVINIIVSQNLSSFLSDDPGAIILYAVSLVVVIPVGQFLTYNYHLKDALFRLLKERIQIKEKREESIMGSLKELVLVVDKDLNIQSFNEAVEKILDLTKREIEDRPLLDILPLESKEGERLSAQDFFIDAILADKAARIINNFYLRIKAKTKSVIIQIRPITNSRGQVSQMVFVITDADIGYLQKHANINQARTKRQMLVGSIRDTIVKSRLKETAVGVELLTKIDEDILAAFEIEDHPIQEVVNLQDIAWITQQAVAGRQEFAKSLDVKLDFLLPDEDGAEAAMINLLASDFPRQSLPISDFTILVDQHWLEIAISKLVDMAVLFASGAAKHEVQVLVSQINKTTLNIKISSFAPHLSASDEQQLFVEYYGQIGESTNLKLGSGLEGFIAKTILTQLEIPLEVKVSGNPQELNFILTLSKLPK